MVLDRFKTLLCTEKSFLKQFGLIQNDLDVSIKTCISSKLFWTYRKTRHKITITMGPQLIGPSGQTVPNQFGPHGQMVPKIWSP